MKYLIKNSYDIFKNTVEEELCNIGGLNFGASIFAYSISRTLMREGDQIDIFDDSFGTFDYLINHPEFFDDYDKVIIPLADYIKVGNFEIIDKLAQLIDVINKPVICPSLTIRYDFIYDEVPDKFEYPTRRLMDAFLRKSAMVGIRDEYEARYLEKLGYKRGEDFEMIGCMSMYTFGDTLPQITPPIITEESKIAVNSNCLIPQYARLPWLHSFFINNTKGRNYSFFPGRIEEVIGRAITYPGSWRRVPIELKKPDFVKEIAPHYNACGNMKTLFNELKNYDFCFGSRMHQCVSALLSGVPTIVIACDWRMLGICEVHNIPHIKATNVTADMNIYDKISEMDFSKIHIGHKERFDKYIDFLHKNGLKTIYDDPKEDVCAFDEYMKNNVELSKLHPQI